jgi:hypothetical protein
LRPSRWVYSTNELTGDGLKWRLVLGARGAQLSAAGSLGGRAHRQAKHSGSSVVEQAT